MSRQSDPCWMGQHDRCLSPYCRCAECGCASKTPVVERDSRSQVWENETSPTESVSALRPGSDHQLDLTERRLP